MKSMKLKSCVGIGSLTSTISLSAAIMRLAAGLLVASLWLVAPALAQSTWQALTFDVPGTSCTYPKSISSVNSVAGDYLDQGLLQGFVRSSDGQIKTFKVPNATKTSVNSINANGAVAGSYYDSKGQYAYVTDPTLQHAYTWTYPSSEAYSISDSGVAVGYYMTGSTPVPFYWSNGVINSFSVPGSGAIAQTIDSSGNIAGVSYSPLRGFVRDAQGTVTTFDIAGVVDMSVGGANGAIAGKWTDANGVQHGFAIQGTSQFLLVSHFLRHTLEQGNNDARHQRRRHGLQAHSSGIVSAAAGARGGGREARPSQSRIFRVASGGWITARIHRRPWQRGHSSTSILKTRIIN